MTACTADASTSKQYLSLLLINPLPSDPKISKESIMAYVENKSIPMYLDSVRRNGKTQHNVIIS